MKRQLNANRMSTIWSSVRWGGAHWIALVAVLGCGGTTTFQDTSPIRIAVAPPAPPPPQDVPQKKVEIIDNRLVLPEKIQFAYNKADVLEVSFSLLDSVVKTIQENPHVHKISIEGHASDEGEEQHNLMLSKARAEAVRVYLVAKGVAPERVSSTGHGESKPIAANDTEEGREKNRRVEFNITKQEVTKEKVEVDPTTGEKKVIEKSSMNEGSEK